MKVLVTGANGYLGQGIVRKLLDDGVEVVATDFKVSHIDDRAGKIEADLFAVEDPYAFFGKPDAVIHLAWKDGFKHNSDAHLEELPKHCRFLKSLVAGGIKLVSVMGTMHEVGFFEGPISEDTPCNPENLYGIAKNALREFCLSLCRQNKVTLQWLRGFYIVGNTMYGDSIFSKITKAAMEGEKTFPFTSGKNQYDFLDYGDFCAQVAAAVEQKEVDGIINICSGQPESLSSRVERFIASNSYDIKLQYGSFPDRPYDSKAVWGDDSKIRMILEEQKRRK
jgi:dTDP-6-deoxy-L-talose 4-dehydrogenase (NAD+)